MIDEAPANTDYTESYNGFSGKPFLEFFRLRIKCSLRNFKKFSRKTFTGLIKFYPFCFNIIKLGIDRCLFDRGHVAQLIFFT